MLVKIFDSPFDFRRKNSAKKLNLARKNSKKNELQVFATQEFTNGRDREI